jgi:deazaflavin-dependent oxidoreductase (nitroreductase family)
MGSAHAERDRREALTINVTTMAGHGAPPPWLKYANKVFMVLLRLGVPVSRHESPVVLTVAGRRTGKARSTPITPMLVGDNRYVVNGYPGADWVRNVRAAGRATLIRGRHTEQVRMVELTPDAAEPILREFPALVPTGVELMKRAGVLQTGTPDELAAMAGRLAVFRIDPVA